MRRFVMVSLTLALTLGTALLSAQDSSPGRVGSVELGSKEVDRQSEREAMDFVRQHHEELAGLLLPLRNRDRGRYEEAVRELSRARENFERLRRRDPERAALALASWKAGSRVELLTARQISRPDPERENELRSALAAQLAAQLALQRYDREQIRKRLDQLDETIRKNEGRAEELVEARLRAVRKKVQRVRRQTGEASRPEPANPQGDEW